MAEGVALAESDTCSSCVVRRAGTEQPARLATGPRSGRCRQLFYRRRTTVRGRGRGVGGYAWQLGNNGCPGGTSRRSLGMVVFRQSR